MNILLYPNSILSNNNSARRNWGERIVYSFQSISLTNIEFKKNVRYINTLIPIKNSNLNKNIIRVVEHLENFDKKYEKLK